jgi:hypothetical protein
VNGAGEDKHPFRLTVRVPNDMASLPSEGTGADLIGVIRGVRNGRDTAIVIAITVAAFDPPAGVAADRVFRALPRARDPEGTALVEEFTTPAGDPAVGVRSTVTLTLRGQSVSVGQAQALVVYREAGALGVISGACCHADELDATAALVAGIAARMVVAGLDGDVAACPVVT